MVRQCYHLDVSGDRAPSYDLKALQDLVADGRYWITKVALNGAAELLMDEDDIKVCVLGLALDDFYKTMPAEQLAGRMQDVYRPTFQGERLYVKLQLGIQQNTVVISFKKR